jgi:tellurite methyltransferase
MRARIRTVANHTRRLVAPKHPGHPMSDDTKPFWEATYRDLAGSTFGPPSEEVQALVGRLPESAVVLDVGCGEGRNALLLARHGCRVCAIGVSRAAIVKLQHLASSQGVALDARQADMAELELDRDFDLVMSHGVLHLLHPDVCDRFLASARRHTVPGGRHVHVVFTDAIAPPPDLAPFVHRLFREGELLEIFADWQIELFRSYVKDDRHPGGEPHQHAINELVVRRPTGDLDSRRGTEDAEHNDHKRGNDKG